MHVLCLLVESGAEFYSRANLIPVGSAHTARDAPPMVPGVYWGEETHIRLLDIDSRQLLDSYFLNSP